VRQVVVFLFLMWRWPFATAVTAASAQSGIGYEHRAWMPVDGAPSGVRSAAQSRNGQP